MKNLMLALVVFYGAWAGAQESRLVTNQVLDSKAAVKASQQVPAGTLAPLFLQLEKGEQSPYYLIKVAKDGNRYKVFSRMGENNEANSSFEVLVSDENGQEFVALDEFDFEAIEAEVSPNRYRNITEQFVARNQASHSPAKLAGLSGDAKFQLMLDRAKDSGKKFHQVWWGCRRWRCFRPCFVRYVAPVVRWWYPVYSYGFGCFGSYWGW